MIGFIRSLLTSELVEQLREENARLVQEKDRLQDLILEHAGYLNGNTLPGIREEPVRPVRNSRKSIKEELERQSLEAAKLEIEEYRKKVVDE